MRRRTMRDGLIAVLAGAVVVLAGCTPSGTPSSSRATNSSGKAGTTSEVPTSPTTTAARATKAVHIKLLEDDTYGPATYGVGMPIVAYFSARITEASDFSKATTITVNGHTSSGGWYFESSAMIKGYPLEAHYRPAPQPDSDSPYWPAHATIAMTMNTKGISAGGGMAFDDSLTLSMKTGDAHISTVDCAAGVEKMTVTSNGATVRTMPTSCGAAATATHTGTKVVMQKGEDLPGTGKLRPNGTVEMIGTGSDPYDLFVPWSVRITANGEYIHAASWNGGNIGQRSTSNGCTNLNTSDAKWFYDFARVGDVVTYSDTGGTKLPTWDGFGDWNVPQAVWRTGGLVPTT